MPSGKDFDEVPGVPSGDSTSMLGLVDQGKLAMPGLVPRDGWKHRVIEPLTPSPYNEDGRVVTEIAGSNLPRLLMFRDSFASRLVPYLAENFSHAVFLWRHDIDTVGSGTGTTGRRHPRVRGPAPPHARPLPRLNPRSLILESSNFDNS